LATGVAATLTAMAPVSHSAATKRSPTEPTGPTPTSAPAGPTGTLRIAYISDGDVWLIDGNLAPRQLTSSGGAERVLLSSDGALIVYTRRNSFDVPVDVHAIRADGTGDTILLAAAQINGLYPLEHGLVFNDLTQIGFIPGTHRLFLNTRGVPQGPGVAKYDDLLQLDADTGALSTIFAPGTAGDFSISPDGTRMAIITHEHISLAHIDGSGMRPDLIVFPSVLTYSEYLYYPKAVWSPDSRAVGFAIPSADPLAANPSGTIWRIPADSGPAVSVATIDGHFFFTQFYAPCLSPDLGRVAFLRETGTTNVRNLILANSDGTDEVVYATGQIQWQGWAPDSAHFLYGLGSPLSMQVGAVGATPVPMGSGIDTRWVDSESFLYLSGSNGAWTLMKGMTDGSSATLATGAGDLGAFDFAR
jgi:hypothetical protein